MKDCPVCEGNGLIPLLEEQELLNKQNAEYFRLSGDSPETMNRCRPCSGTGSVPEDYEPCDGCGFDHSYEPGEAAQAHHVAQDHGSFNWY